ncbi:MAG: alpha/beta hydrolase [Propionibacteriaceae bacterium]
MMEIRVRQRVTFVSGGTECVGWHYPGATGACVVMAAGLGIPHDVGTYRFARRFHEAGYSVLSFDYRGFGDSGGQPRQVLSVADQLDDWSAALRCAARLPGVEPTRVGIWGSSVSGGHVVVVAARHPDVAAVVAQTPNLDGPASTQNAVRFQTFSGLWRTAVRAVADTVTGLVGRAPRLIALAGPPGAVALLTTPDAQEAGQAFDPEHPDSTWQPTVAARAMFPLSRYRPSRFVGRVRCPLLMVVADQDQSALSAPAVASVRSAVGGELVWLPGGHYSPYLAGHEQAVAAELDFLLRHLPITTAQVEAGAADTSIG